MKIGCQEFFPFLKQRNIKKAIFGLLLDSLFLKSSKIIFFSNTLSNLAMLQKVSKDIIEQKLSVTVVLLQQTPNGLSNS